MKKKRILLAIIILFWVVIAIALIFSRRFTLQTGTKVLLETRPVDPRDILRGDYVILDYEINTIDLNKITHSKQYYKPGEIVYVKLQPKGKYWKAVAIVDKKDIRDNSVYIKARVKNGRDILRIDPGIGSYFVPEGKGKEIETSMRGAGNKVSVEVCVDRFGNAVINKIYINDNEVRFD